MKRVIKICIFGVLLVLAGCRSESLVETEELHQENAKKIVFFENYAKNKNYKYDAEWLNYDDVNNPAIPFAQTLRAYLMNNERDVQEIARQYGRLDLEVSSPVFTDDKTGRQMVYFPILKGKEVSAVLSCVVEKDFSRMGFAVYPKSENLKGIIAEFQSHYFNETRLSTFHKNNDGDGTEKDPKEIKEITIVKIISPPNHFCISFYLDVNPDNDCGSIVGGRGRKIIGVVDPVKNPFPDWFPDGGGDEPPPPSTPCENTKDQIVNNENTRGYIEKIKTHANKRTGTEIGYRFNKDGSITDAPAISRNRLKVGDPNKLNGFYHNHTGQIDIFSPHDISSLIEMARFQPMGNKSNAFMGVIGYGDVHYIIRWNNNDQNSLPIFGSFTEAELEVLKNEQWDFFLATFSRDKPKLNREERLERVFYQTLDRMGHGIKDNIVLQKVDKNNNISTVNLNSDGTTSSKPCN